MDLQQQLQHLELVNRITRRMASTLVLTELLQDVVAAIRQNSHFDHVMILTLDDSNRRICLQAEAGETDPSPPGYSRALGEGIIGTVAETGKSILANDVSHEPAYLAVRPETRSQLCVPILLSGEVLGVINLESAALNAFGQEDRLLLETIADQLAVAMRNARVYEDCRRAKEHFQRLIENSADAISTADLQGRITFWSPGASALFGYSVEEAIGMNVDQFYAGGHEEARRMMKLLRQKQHLSNWEAEYITKDGRCFAGSLTISLLFDEAGHPAGTLGIIRDISEFRALQQQLLQAERLAAIGGLTSQIAHELRNPLSTVKMNINILLKKLEPSAPERRYLHLAASGTDRLESIIGEMFDYVRPFRLSPGPFDPCFIVDSALRQVEELCQQRRARVERSFAANLPAVWADGPRLEQALVNLYTNALQALPDGGSLSIECSASSGAEPRLQIKISDTGRGIEPEHLGRIFEPFFTTRSEGTGLGMSVVKKIVDLHGGTVHVQSRAGQGTTVILLLPIHPGKIS